MRCAALVVMVSLVMATAKAAFANEVLTIRAEESGEFPGGACLLVSKDILTKDKPPLDELFTAATVTKDKRIKLLCACNSLLESDKCQLDKAGKFQKIPSRLLYFQVFGVPDPRSVIVSLDGSQLHVAGAWDSPPAWIVYTSHYYAPGSTAIQGKNGVFGLYAELPLVPQKLKRTFALPEVSAADAWGLELKIYYEYLNQNQESVTEQRPLGSAGGAVDVELPSNVRSATINIGKNGQGLARYHVARFPDSSVKEPIPVRAQMIRFWWEPRGCLSPPTTKDDCPNAMIRASGIPCSSTLYEGKCSYMCELKGSSSTFEIPADVQMSIKPQDDAWTERIVRPNQTVSGTPSRDTRQFVVYLPWQLPENKSRGRTKELLEQDNEWRHSRPKKQELVHVDLFAHDGRAFRVDVDPAAPAGKDAPRNPVRLNIPGATCNDRLTYQYWGRYQNYEPGSLVLDNGQYVLRPPRDTFRRWWIGARLSLGFLWSKAFDAAAGEAFVRVPGAKTAGEIEGTIQRRFFDAPHVVEGFASYMIAQREYVPMGTASASHDAHLLLANRMFFGLRYMFGFREDIWVGTGSGVMAEWAADQERSPFIGRAVASFFFDPLVARYMAFRVVDFQATARFVLPERVRVYTAEPAMSSRFDTVYSAGFMFLVGAGFTIPPP
jgi:hypothetical protein